MGVCRSQHSSPTEKSRAVDFCISIDMLTMQGRPKEGDVVGHQQRNYPPEAEASVSDRCEDLPAWAPSGPVQEILQERFAVIGRGLDEYCENPSAGTFMQIYTCIYDLCNGRGHKNAVCRSVYELHSREMDTCAQRLVASCQKLAGAPLSLQEVIPQVLLEWQWLSRRFHVLQASFGYLDRYYVPRARLETLSAFRVLCLNAAGFQEHALAMWNVMSSSFRDGYATIGFQRMHELAEAWGTLVQGAGMQDLVVTTASNKALREHLAASFTEGRGPLGSDAALSTASNRVLGMQRPLVGLIIEFLSEEDLWQVYSVSCMQTNVSLA